MRRRVDGGYAWVAVGAAFAAHVIAFGLIYSFTVFFPSIVAEFGQGRGQTAWIVSIAAALMLGAGGVTGRLSDRFGPGWILSAGGVLIAAGLFLSSHATALWHVLAAYGLLLGFGVSCAFIPSVATVTQWFERRRGLAIGIAVSGTGVGTLVIAPLSERMIDAYGWRPSMRILAGVGLGVLLLAGSVLRGRMERARGGGARALVRGNRTFRWMYAGSLVASFGYWVPFVHIVPYATDRGISKAAAAALVAIMGIANTTGRILMGAIADRVGRLRILQASSLAMTVALFAWPALDSWRGLAVFGSVYGLFAGAFIALLPALSGDYFGMQRLAGVTGLLFTGAALGTLLGAPVVGMLFDELGTYTIGIVLAGTGMAVGLLFLLPLPDPTHAAAARMAAIRQPDASERPAG